MSKESAQEAYDSLAPIYDDFTAANNYEMWLGELLLPAAESFGLQVGRVLDIGCGTGRAFPPLLRRGWTVVGCDASPGMLEVARQTYGTEAKLFCADARRLPRYDEGPFDLVIALNDVVNCLTEDGDLERVFGGIERNLAPQGLAIFDTNTLSLFEQNFGSGLSHAMSIEGWQWHGLTQPIEPGRTFEARVSGPDVEPHIHRQRHWDDDQVVEALEASGLRRLAAFGQRETDNRILLSEVPVDDRDEKVIHVAALKA
jgi:SAM-dependent methyltransferase